MSVAATPRLQGLALWGVLLVAGCAEAPGARMAMIDNAATVIGPEATLDPAAPPADWFAGPGAGRSFAVVDRDGHRAIEVRGAETALGRRLSVPLLAAPFLRWAWRVEPGGAESGVRLIVGLERRGAAPARPPSRLELALIGTAGGARVTASLDGGRPVLLRRADPQASATWLIEAIDLAALLRQLSPTPPDGELSVVFVAVGGVGRRGDARALGQVAEVVLSR